MSISVSQLVLEVKTTGVPEAEAQLKHMGEIVDKTQSGFKSMLSGALSFAGGIGIFNLASDALGFLKDQFSGMLQESMDAQDELAQTNKVLQSTHDASGMTAQAILDLAANFSHLTKFTDDQTQVGENLLLTFTNIGKNIFPQATQAMLDLSQAMGQDVKSSAIQLGKALNDPLTGMTALQRVGVTFSDSQKEAVKRMMATNDLAGAQGIILKELQREFGGSAEAAGKTFGGQLAILNQRLDDVRQTIGDALMPILTGFLTFVDKSLMPILEGFADWFVKRAIPALQDYWRWIQDKIIPILTDLWKFIQEKVIPALADFSKWIGEKVISALQDYWKFIQDKVIPILQSFNRWIQEKVIPALESLRKFIEDKVVPALQAMWKFIEDKVVPALQDAYKWIQEKVVLALQAAYKWINDHVIPVLLGLWNTLTNKVVPKVQDWYNKIMGLVGGIEKWNEKNAALSRALSFVGLTLQQVWSILTNQIEPTFNQVKKTVDEQLTPAFQGLVKALAPFAPELEKLKPYLLGLLVPLAIVAVQVTLFIGALAGITTAMGNAVRGVALGVGGIVQFFSGLVMQVSAYLQALDDLIHGKFDKIGKDMKLNSDGFKMTWSGAWNIIQGIWYAGFGGIIEAGKAFDTAVFNIFVNLYNSLVGHSIVPDTVNAIVAWFASLPGRALGAVRGLLGGLAGFFGGIASQAFSWGSNIVQGVINGLLSKLGSVGNAAQQIAQTVADFLPHSPAKEGPLSKLNEFGPALVKGFSQGIIDSTPTLTASITHMVQPIAPGSPTLHYAFPSPVALASSASSGSGGGTTHVDVHVHIGTEDVTHLLGAQVVNHIRRKTGIRV